MERNERLTIDLYEVVHWTNWSECSSRMLSLTRPPKELLVFFAIQSIRRAYCLKASLDECPREIIDGHIRGYLLDRVWSYHLVTRLVYKDVWARVARVVPIDPNRLLRASRAMVAQVMLRRRSPSQGSAVRTSAERAVLRSLSLPAWQPKHPRGLRQSIAI